MASLEPSSPHTSKTREINAASDSNPSGPSINGRRLSQTGLSPSELRDLASGSTVPIFIGPLGREYIVVESAYKKLLCHFSPYCKRLFSSSDHARIYIPSGIKETIGFLYRWMLSGGGSERPIGTGPGLTFDDLRIPDLIALYGHAKHLEIEELKQKVVRKLQWKLQRVFLLVDQIDHAWRHIPEIKSAVVSSTARLFLLPKVLDYTSWTQYASINRDFGQTLDRAIRVRLGSSSSSRNSVTVSRGDGGVAAKLNRNQNRPRGRREENAPNFNKVQERPEEHHPETVPRGGRQRKPNRKPQAGSTAIDATTTEPARQKRFRQRKAFVPNAVVAGPTKQEGPEPSAAQPLKKETDSTDAAPAANNHRPRPRNNPNIPRERQQRPDNVRDQLYRPDTKPNPGKPDSRPTQRNHRQPLRERHVNVVELVSNGEGITTSHREMRRGEMTRLGMKI